MPAFDPVAALLAYHKAINDLDFEAIDQAFANDAVYASPGTGDTKGRDAIVAAFRSYFSVYPDQVAEDEKIERTGPLTVFSIWRLTATQAETGEPLLRRGEQTLTFNDDGKIVRVDVRDYA